MSATRHRFLIPGLCFLAAVATSLPATAQQANPGYDPRQTEKRFEHQQIDHSRGARPRLPRSPFARPDGRGDTKPMFVLKNVAITGAVAIPRDRLVTAYQPYLGKKVSQADLADMASAVSDVYRAAGFHLSRAIVPVQDIKDGTIRLQVIEGSIVEVALKGEGAEQFGVRPMLDAWRWNGPRGLRRWSGNCCWSSGGPACGSRTPGSRRSAPPAAISA
jgi:hemolysin activation/secretion protein